jgi:omega-amidase
MKFKIALCQMDVTEDKLINLKKAEQMIREAAESKAQMVVLPEMFNCPYTNSFFSAFAEGESGITVQTLSALAKELEIYLIGGTIPEKAGAAIYNTCFAFDKSGHIIGKHRKVHLFDIDIKGGIRFKESEVLGRGHQITVIDTEYCKVGIGICYDMRFPELIRLMTLKGAQLIVVPGAFNMTTGPAHWELTIRTRALDNQVYFAAASPARNMEASYHAFGHSGIVNPWGEFAGKTDEKESIVYADIDLDYVHAIREQLPLLRHRREDIYKLDEV